MFAAVFIQVGEARRSRRMAHVGRENEEDACRTTVLLVFTEAAPGPRLSRVGSARFPFNKEGGRYYTVDAAGHFYFTKVATSQSREGFESVARLRGRMCSVGTEICDRRKSASKGAAAVGCREVEGVLSEVARHYCILRFSRKVRPAHVTKAPRTRLPNFGVSSGPLHKTPKGHPPGPAVEEA